MLSGVDKQLRSAAKRVGRYPVMLALSAGVCGLFCNQTIGAIMQSQDIFVEVGHGPTLIDNNVLMSRVSLRVATQGVAMVHNLIMGSFTFVGGGTTWRYTPYHIRHRTEVAGFMTILHGDDRFYNNVFMQVWPMEKEPRRGEPKPEEQRVGTWCWDEYPTYEEWIANFDLDVARPNMHKLEEFHNGHLPVWAGGNAYFNGAAAWKKEKDHLVDTQHTATVVLKEDEQGIRLETNLPELLKDYRTGVINSDILGRAFEPDQRFEDPDGSAIVFDRDYFGNHREGVSVMPGPFADAASLEKALW